LVVISIISFLSSVIISSTSTTRAKAIDAKTLVQTQQFQKALYISASDPASMPAVPATGTYYCLGKKSTETANMQVQMLMVSQL